jgi:hypothetical protein
MVELSTGGGGIYFLNETSACVINAEFDGYIMKKHDSFYTQ